MLGVSYLHYRNQPRLRHLEVYRRRQRQLKDDFVLCLALQVEASLRSDTSEHEISSSQSEVGPDDAFLQPLLVSSRSEAYLDSEPSQRSQVKHRSLLDSPIVQMIEEIKRPLAEDESPARLAYEDEEDSYFFPAFLSHISVRLQSDVPRDTHLKGSIPYPETFTGKDLVDTIQAYLSHLQLQLFFCEVEWGSHQIEDDISDVYMFLGDQDDVRVEPQGLPSGVMPMLTGCYSTCCNDELPCYAYSCPKRKPVGASPTQALASNTDRPAVRHSTSQIVPSRSISSADYQADWADNVPLDLLQALPAAEINRQSIIHKIITQNQQYIQDLNTVESLFIVPLRQADPPIIRPSELEIFIKTVFSTILDVRACTKRVLDALVARQREQAPVINAIGDIFLEAATQFRVTYSHYLGHLPAAEKRVQEEMDSNVMFRVFVQQATRHPDARRLELKHFLSRPSIHLQKSPAVLEAVYKACPKDHPDVEFLKEAVLAIRQVQNTALLCSFQFAMGKGSFAALDWTSFVAEEVLSNMPRREMKRQNIIFELIKGEMEYVKDLESIEIMYVLPLREAMPPIVPSERLAQFCSEVFHNYAELLDAHRDMLRKLHHFQREGHPIVHSITATLYDAILNFRDAYVKYIPNYPIAEYRIDDEMAKNPAFKAFVEQCTRHPDANRLDMKHFVNRPIPRLLRYELLLKSILDETPDNHDDKTTIPLVLEAIKALGWDTERGVFAAKQKVEIWRYHSQIVFKDGEAVDLDLLNTHRALLHTGKALRQPETGFDAWNNWIEVFVLLFDNYMVIARPKEKDGETTYLVDKRASNPLPLDLITPVNFTEPPRQRATNLRNRLRPGERHDPSTSSPDPEADTRVSLVYPCTVHRDGRFGGIYTMFTESAQARTEWKQKLDEAIGLRRVVQDSVKAFEVETLNAETFAATTADPYGYSSPTRDHVHTGEVTCSAPFVTPTGRNLLAIGCAEGVWIGFRHDPTSMRRVLHLKLVTQCMMLEEFGLFLVLADKSLFAYDREAIVPSSFRHARTSRAPQKLSRNRDVHFFSVGKLEQRTVLIYMEKKGASSVFRVLEPIFGRVASEPPTFREYWDFTIPVETYGMAFVNTRVVICSAKGFEIMVAASPKLSNIPVITAREGPQFERLAKRCETCRPLGMFHVNEEEFLLCYNEFGLYVDRHGEPSRSAQVIEWEGTAVHAAWHFPYVLLFNALFIEIRHIETGHLAQIIPGNDIRCICDGRGSRLRSPTTPGDSQELRVQGVMNAPNASAIRTMGNVAQNVFELFPIVST
ncbi:hypothetical protein EIP91_004317 [Steccherinum ochraceum]|uniref:RHO1 GDP-GTP exchange protein 2 n=1 Tax=Steccherinum ochraceum TaxID=92696 RepID=A0A4R0RKC7_9APHY|nr:hypothetical protein EIP91_004317 [Steccherinum ochraceum]